MFQVHSRARLAHLMAAVCAVPLTAAATAAAHSGAAQDAPAVAPPATEAEPATLAPVDSPAIEAASRERLARALATLAGKQVRKDQLSVADLELGLILAETATELDPTNIWAWRGLFWIASANDPADERVQDLRRKALDQIVRLDPTDEVMRLRRIVDIIEQDETADARIAKYQGLLTPENQAILGKRVSARLALDLALLLQRTGDQAGFEHWLAEAAILDPAFPAAATMAAGYFRFASDDPAQEAELLVAAMIANPLDSMAMRAFATVLLEYGAYQGAARFLGLCERREHTEYPVMAYDELLGEYALAQMANRDFEGADLTVRTRQQELNDYFRTESTRADPTLLGDPTRMAALSFPVQPQQAAIRVAAVRSLGQETFTQQAVEDLWKSLDAAIQRAELAVTEAEGDEDRKAAVAGQAASLLESAFIGVWLGEDAARGRAYLEAADAAIPLSDNAKARFAAWERLRTGDTTEALAAFDALPETNALARLGRAIALESVGRARDSAKELLALARENPGALVGIDAKRRLERMLGANLPPDEVGASVEAIASEVPVQFDKMFQRNARVTRLRIRRYDTPAHVYDPMPITIEVTNESPIPLAIDPAGPLRDLISAEMTVLAAGQESALDMPPYMIQFARTFSIGPRETLAIPFDVAYSDAGAIAITNVVPGCGITVHAILNWEAAVGGVGPGVFGDDADLSVIRVDGVSVTPEWVDGALMAIADPKTPQDLVDISALVWAAASANAKPGTYDEQTSERLKLVWPALKALLPRLDPVTQAWLVTVLPDPTRPLDDALEPMRAASDRTVRLCYLVRRTSRSGDPVVDAAIRSEDATIARYGRLVKDMLFNEEEKLRRDFNIGGTDRGRDTSGPERPEQPAPPATTPPTNTEATPGEAPPAEPTAKP